MYAITASVAPCAVSFDAPALMQSDKSDARELTSLEIDYVSGACSLGGLGLAALGGAVAGGIGGAAAGAIFGPGALIGAGAGAVSVGITNSVLYVWDNCFLG